MGVPHRAQQQTQLTAGAQLLNVQDGADMENLPFGFWDMLINFIQVVEANLVHTLRPESSRRSWSPMTYELVHSRVEAVIGQSIAEFGAHTERLLGLREYAYATYRALEASGILHKLNEIAALKTQLDDMLQTPYQDQTVSGTEAARRQEALETALLACHPLLVKRVHCLLQHYDYVEDLTRPVNFTTPVRRLFGNLVQDPDVFKRLGLNHNRPKHMLTMHFHKSAQWRADMFRAMFGPRSAAMFNQGAADPGFNTVHQITMLFPAVSLAVGAGAHRVISSASRRRYTVTDHTEPLKSYHYTDEHTRVMFDVLLCLVSDARDPMLHVHPHHVV